MSMCSTHLPPSANAIHFCLCFVLTLSNLPVDSVFAHLLIDQNSQMTETSSFLNSAKIVRWSFGNLGKKAESRLAALYKEKVFLPSQLEAPSSRRSRMDFDYAIFFMQSDSSYSHCSDQHASLRMLRTIFCITLPIKQKRKNFLHVNFEKKKQFFSMIIDYYNLWLWLWLIETEKKSGHTHTLTID